MSDDQTGKYLARRDTAYLTPSQMLDLEDSAAPEVIAPDPGGQSFNFSPARIGGDILRGITEAPRQVIGGIVEATEEAADAAQSLFDALNIPSVLALTNERGEFDPKLMTGKEFEKAGGVFPSEEFKVKEPESVTGGMIRGISQFLTGFLPASKAFRVGKAATAGGKAVRAMLAGAVTDATVFDPHEERLANLIEQNPELSNPVTQYLAASPGDSEAESRFKNALEGMGLGVFTEGFFHAVRGVRGARQRKILAAQQADEQAQIQRLAALPAEEGEEILPSVLKEEEPEPRFKPFDETDEPAFKVGAEKAGMERAVNINPDRLDTTDDVKGLIDGVAEKFAKDINEERRQIITLQETEALADELGMSVDSLLKRRRGEAFNAEQAVAARKILVASGENLIKLAKQAATGGDVDVVKFRKAMATHHAIQSQVSGLTAEAGRALSSFRIMAKSAREQERMISEAIESTGGVQISRDIAADMALLESPKQINTFVKQASTAKTRVMLYEAWINGLLSSPATHAVNILSNSITAAFAVGERRIASAIGAGLDFQNIHEGEAASQLVGAVQGAKEGLSLAWKALKTGEPSDVLTKIETAQHKAISGEAFGLSGTPGMFADYVGETVRLPGRFLTAGDEFFKTVGYRMELHAQAFRQAQGEGLDGQALADRIAEIIDNPPENIKLSAIDASRYQTFTNELGPGGKAVQNLQNKIPPVKVIMPFVRTPINIMNYMGERTIAAPLYSKVRADIMAGGARRDLALARIATGSMIMAAAADYALSGQVTGGGPTNPQMKNILRATGWQPYSIKWGDTYYSYSRLDPIGGLIGVAADAAEAMGQVSDADAVDIASSAVIAVAQNVTSKTYLSGVAEFFDVMTSISADPEAKNKRPRKWIERMVGSAVPAAVAQAERVISPELSATQGIIEKLKSRIPGYSEDLPPRRNIFGEPVVLQGGLGPDIMSPIYTSTAKKDPVADEIVKQETLLRMPRNIIDGVELNTHQYDEYIKLYAGQNNRFVKMPLKQMLRETFRSPMYMNATEGQEGGKSLIIRSIFENYRSAAKAAMLEKDTRLKLDVMDKKREKAIKLGVR